jgi:hypothetical protein
MVTTYFSVHHHHSSLIIIIIILILMLMILIIVGTIHHPMPAGLSTYFIGDLDPLVLDLHELALDALGLLGHEGRDGRREHHDPHAREDGVPQLVPQKVQRQSTLVRRADLFFRD